MRHFLRRVLIGVWFIPMISVANPLFDWLFFGRIDWKELKDIINFIWNGVDERN